MTPLHRWPHCLFLKSKWLPRYMADTAIEGFSRLRAVSLFPVVRRAKRETHKWPRAWLMALVSRVLQLRRFRAHALLSLMYWSNRGFNMHPPPGIWKLLFKFLPTRSKMQFKCPTLGSIQVIKYPHPGDISQAHVEACWSFDLTNT